MSSHETVWLVGMMGSGKSVVGRALAARLGRPFVDTDAEIAREAKQTIPEIFAEQGEAAFRALERAVIDGLAGRPLVVALGGGAIAQPGAAARLTSSGTVVHLRARPDTLLERVHEGADRPLLAGLDREGRLERLRALLAERAPAYAAAQVVIDTDGLGVSQVADAVVRALGAPRGGEA